METVKYIVLKQPLNVRTAVTGSIEICPPDMVTAYHLWDRLQYEKIVNASPGYYVMHGNRTGKIEDWGHILVPGETYTICPDVNGALGLVQLIASLVLTAASIGYSIYSYMDMKSMISDLANQDPTQGDGSASQSYSYASKENYRTDNLPIPIVYGKTKVGGVVINELQYGPNAGESEAYKVHVALAEGPITGISSASDILLNDSLLTEYANYSWAQSTGGVSPSASTIFTELYQQHFPENELRNNFCLYFPFTYSSSTVLSVACQNKSMMREVGDPNNYTPTYNDSTGCSISTSVCPAGITTASLRIGSTNAGMRYAGDFKEFFQPGADPFNIEWRMYYSASDLGYMGTTATKYLIMNHNSSAGGREWEMFGAYANSTTVGYQFVCSEGASTSLKINSIALPATAYQNGWHHYRICRDGEYARFFIDGVDKTDIDSLEVPDNCDVYASGGTNYFYFGGSSHIVGVGIRAFKCYMTDVRMDSGGNVAYKEFSVPTVAHDPSIISAIHSEARGKADKLMWQYKWPGGCFFSDIDGSTYTRQGNLFQESIQRNGHDIFCYDNQGSGAGNSSALELAARQTYGRNNAILIRQTDLPLDFIKIAKSSSAWNYGELITGSVTGHTGELAGYRYDGTYDYLYLRNPTGIFSTSDTAEGAGGGRGKVQDGGTLQTETTYEALEIFKVSPSWDYTYRKNTNTLKSVTEVRGFRDITAIDGVTLTYPHLASLAIDITAQKGLTSIPKINAILTGFTLKTLYRWDTTALAPVSLGYKNLRNPAWACWDIMTDGFWHNGTAYSRGGSTGQYEGYGLGISPKYMDIYSFTEWSSYCTATVGGVTRCNLNISLDEKDKTLWDALDSIALVGRGRLVPMGNKWYAKINEKVTSPVMVVGGALIEAGSYEEEYIDDSDKKDEINIKFLNEDNKYIEDVAGDASSEWDDPTEYDIFKSETIFVKGITNSDQAKREAILRRQQIASLYKRIRFIMDVDAVNFEVGDVIQVQHDSNKYTYSAICQGAGEFGFGVYFVKISVGGIGDRTLNLPGKTYGNDGRLAWRNNTTDNWQQATILGPFDTETNIIYISTEPDIANGDPVYIGTATTVSDSDFDLIRVEELNLTGDMRVEIIGFNYDESVYTHPDYGSTAI